MSLKNGKHLLSHAQLTTPRHHIELSKLQNLTANSRIPFVASLRSHQ